MTGQTYMHPARETAGDSQTHRATDRPTNTLRDGRLAGRQGEQTAHTQTINEFYTMDI